MSNEEDTTAETDQGKKRGGVKKTLALLAGGVAIVASIAIDRRCCVQSPKPPADAAAVVGDAGPAPEADAAPVVTDGAAPGVDATAVDATPAPAVDAAP